MQAWKNKKVIIFGLEGVLLDLKLEILITKAEKFLFYVNNLGKITYLFSSNQSKNYKDLINKTGLNCFFDKQNIIFPGESQFFIENKAFWQNFMVDNNINPNDIFLIHNSVDVLTAASGVGIDGVCVLKDKPSSIDNIKKIRYINGFAELLPETLTNMDIINA